MADNPTKTRPIRWQFGVRAMLLLTAAFAVWFSYFQDRAEIARLGPRVAVMRSLARELIVADVRKIAVVRHGELWWEDKRWEVYLPEGGHRLNLATRGIDGKGLSPPHKSVEIAGGTHQLALEQKLDGETWRLTATLDGRRVLEAAEPKAWDPGAGSTGGGEVSTSTQFDGDEPVVLFRRRFTRPGTTGPIKPSDGPRDGILMWIEKAH